MRASFYRLNIVKECRGLRIGLSACPPFLFLILGFSTIISIIAASLLTSRYFEDPEGPTVIISSTIAVMFLILGNLIISGFNRIAEANRMKSEFIAIASHQLRSPLSVFKWTLEALDHSIKNRKDWSDIEGSVDNLSSATQKMIRLVNTLLEVSRIDAGTLVLDLRACSLEAITRTCLEHLRVYMEASRMRVNLEIDADVPLVKADPQQTATVIEHMLDNAIRYTALGGDAAIRIQKAGAYVTWSIQDTGIGVPASQQKYLFQKFFRGGNSTRYQTAGSGVGLYIAKTIINASGGDIGFTSKEGDGSTFWFTLPINRPTA